MRFETWHWDDGSDVPTTECSVERGSYTYSEMAASATYGVDYDRGRWRDTSYDGRGVVYTDRQGSTHRRIWDGESIEDVLLGLTDASEVWLEFSEPSVHWTYDDATVSDLFRQWMDHWCVDDDADGYCDRIPSADDETSFPAGPPMTGSERRDLARCLNQTRITTKSVRRRGLLVSGPVNWPRLVQWYGECGTDSDERPLADLPADPDPVDDLEVCASFQGWLYRTERHVFSIDGRLGYICHRGLSYDDDYTRGQIRSFAEDRSGDFHGFECLEGVAGERSVLQRYDTSSLRRSRVLTETHFRDQLPVRTFD